MAFLGPHRRKSAWPSCTYMFVSKKGILLQHHPEKAKDTTTIPCIYTTVQPPFSRSGAPGQDGRAAL